MSKFVNYNKREFTLPPGCKDLIDVLRPHLAATPAKSAVASERPSVTRGYQTVGRLSEVPRYVSMLVTSRSELFTLMIGTTDDRLSIVLHHSDSEGVSALVLVSGEAERARAIREFFRRHGIAARQDYLILADAGGAPVRGLIYPLAAAAPQSSQIAIDLLRSVHGFSDDSAIQFRYYEITNAA